MYTLWNLVRYFFVLSLLFTFIRGAVSQDELCTGHQSQSNLDYDTTLDCRNDTLNFYEKLLLGSIRNYVAVQTNVARWWAKNNNEFNGFNLDYWSAVANESYERMQHIVPLKNEYKIKIIYNSDIEYTINLLIKEALKVFASFQLSTTENNVICPFGCEFAWNPYYWMFLVSALCNLMLGGVTMSLVWCLDKRDTVLARLETVECELMKRSVQDSKSRPTMVIPPYEIN